MGTTSSNKGLVGSEKSARNQPFFIAIYQSFMCDMLGKNRFKKIYQIKA
jgi:hypothetical protein